MGLVADLANEDGLFGTRFQAEPLEGGAEVLGQAASDRDPVAGWLHVPLRWSAGQAHYRTQPGEQSLPMAGFTRVSRAFNVT